MHEFVFLGTHFNKNKMGQSDGKVLLEKRYSLSEEQIRDFKRIFDSFDLNNDGQICTKELGSILRGLHYNPTEKELRLLMEQVDANGNGTLDFTEFLLMMERKVREVDEQEILTAFRQFDRDGNGLISADEIFQVLSGTGEGVSREEVDDMIKVADKDGDGQVDFEGEQGLCYRMRDSELDPLLTKSCVRNNVLMQVYLFHAGRQGTHIRAWDVGLFLEISVYPTAGIGVNVLKYFN